VVRRAVQGLIGLKTSGGRGRFLSRFARLVPATPSMQISPAKVSTIEAKS
jgi:hypothetical protein